MLHFDESSAAALTGGAWSGEGHLEILLIRDLLNGSFEGWQIRSRLTIDFRNDGVRFKGLAQDSTGRRDINS